MKVTIVVPAYNGEHRISEAVRALRGLSERLPPEVSCRVYVVDDGSTDRTAALAEEAGADRVIRHYVNQGLGAAVRTGLSRAHSDGTDLVVKFDADLQHEVADIPALIAPIVDDAADLVYGDRFQRIDYRMPIVRRVGNIVFTTLMRWLTGWPVRDAQPGIFAAAKRYLEMMHLPGDYNYTQQVLLDAYHKGMRFAQVPVSFHRRLTGRSFVSSKYPFAVLTQILLVLLGVKPMKVFGTLGLTFLVSAGFVFAVEFVQWLLGEAPKPVLHVNLVLGLSLFGLQTIFFGLLAELIVRRR